MARPLTWQGIVEGALGNLVWWIVGTILTLILGSAAFKNQPVLGTTFFVLGVMAVVVIALALARRRRLDVFVRYEHGRDLVGTMRGYSQPFQDEADSVHISATFSEIEVVNHSSEALEVRDVRIVAENRARREVEPVETRKHSWKPAQRIEPNHTGVVSLVFEADFPLPVRRFRLAVRLLAYGQGERTVSISLDETLEAAKAPL